MENYLGEKELFILFSLLRKKIISNFSSERIFDPNGDFTFREKEDIDKNVNKALEMIKSKERSPKLLSCLLELGKKFDEKSFSIFCNADYSLLEGGFLTDYIGDIMYQYLEDTNEGRKDKDKYKKLNKEIIKFLGEILSGKRNINETKDSVLFTNLANPPIKEYRETILNKKADKEFIELVNELITEYDGGRWDKSDIRKFLKIYYKHNREENNKSIIKGKGFFHGDSQTKLAKLLFENIGIWLLIKNGKILKKYLLTYFNHFINDDLNGISGSGLTGYFTSDRLDKFQDEKFFGFKKQRDVLVKHIKSVYGKYQRNDLEINHPYIKSEYIGDVEKGSGTITGFTEEESLFLFVHTIIALEYQNYLEIEDFLYGEKGLFDLYRRSFVFKIKLKETFFKEFCKSKVKNKKLLVWLDNGGIQSESGVIFPFKIIKGVKTLPRTKMIVFLSKQNKNIPTNELTKKSSYSEAKALKRSVKDINRVFISSLGEEFINHDKANGTFGINREKFNFSCRLQ